MRKTKSLHKSGILFITLAILFFISLNYGLGAQKNTSSSCYEKGWMKRATFIRNYISLFKDNEKKLNLSKEQVEKLEEILSICTNTCNKLSLKVEEAEKTLEDLLLKIDEKSDKKVIIEKTKALYSLKAKLELSHFQLLGKAEEILTDEQKEILKKIPPPALK